MSQAPIALAGAPGPRLLETMAHCRGSLALGQLARFMAHNIWIFVNFQMLRGNSPQSSSQPPLLLVTQSPPHTLTPSPKTPGAGPGHECLTSSSPLQLQIQINLLSLMSPLGNSLPRLRTLKDVCENFPNPAVHLSSADCQPSGHKTAFIRGKSK